MSKQRMVRDSFWTDSYVERLTPDEKLLFIYLLTNPQCNIAGIFELRSKRIAFETGYDIEVVKNILGRFAKDEKIFLFEDWIVLINSPKHQNIRNEKIQQGIKRIFEEDLPPKLIEAMRTDESYMSHCTLLYSTLLNLTLPNSTLPKKSETKPKVEKPTKGFDEFWLAYPKKAGKGAAEKAWEKMSPDLTVVLKSLSEHKTCDQWTRDNGKFIPHPATWLNQKRWEDEVEVKNTNTKYAKYDE
jgi:hypothetical protein